MGGVGISIQPGAKSCPSPQHPRGSGSTYSWPGLFLRLVTGDCAGSRERGGC